MTGPHDDDEEGVARRLMRQKEEREKAELLDRVRTLEAGQRNLAEIAVEIKKSVTGPGAASPAPSGFAWHRLEDDAERATRWAALQKWLREVYVPRYPEDAKALAPAVGQDPCWVRHPEVVDLVTHTWRAWAAAFDHSKGTAVDGMRWHYEWRPKATERIGKLLKNCRRAEGHQDPDVPDVDLIVVSELPEQL